MPSSHPRPSRPASSKSPISRGKLLFEIYRRTKLGVMPAGCKLVLLVLADFVNENGVAWPSHDALMAACGCSIGTIKGAIDKLEDHGWIEVLSVGGGRESSRYRVQMGRPIAVDKGVSEAVSRYKATLIRREVDKRLKNGEFEVSEADVAADLFAQEGSIDSMAGCQPETPSLPAGDPDLLREAPQGSEDFPFMDPRVRALQGHPDRWKGCFPPVHDPEPSSSSTPTPKPNKPVEEAPTTNRSPSGAPSSNPKSQDRKPPWAPQDPMADDTNLPTARQILSWVADNKPLLTLLQDREQAEQWADDTACAMAWRATQSRHVKQAVYAFALRNSVECRELTRNEVFKRLASSLAFAKNNYREEQPTATTPKNPHAGVSRQVFPRKLEEKNKQPTGNEDVARMVINVRAEDRPKHPGWDVIAEAHR